MKEWGKKLGIFIAILVVLGLAFGDDEEKDKDKDKGKGDKAEDTTEVVADEEGGEADTDTVVADEPEPEPEPEPEAEEVVADEPVNNEAAEELALIILKNNMGEVADVQYNSTLKMFMMTPTDPLFASDLELLLQGYGTDTWKYLLDTMSDLSSTLQELIGDGYSIALLNPLNPDRVIVEVTDGKVVYDAISELHQ